MNLDSMGANEWLLIASALLGPVLAVQAQKAVERSRERDARKLAVFTVLMATRQNRLSAQHVEALNSIDIAFYGRRVLWFPLRLPVTREVITAWGIYRRHLSPAIHERPNTPEKLGEWQARGDELFINLLEKLASALRFRFDRESLKSGSYSPEAHGQFEAEQSRFRSLMLELLDGQRALPMSVVSMPENAEAQQRLIAALEALAKR